MGHQVCYLCDRDDAQQLQDSLKAGPHPVVFMRGESPLPEPILIESLLLEPDDLDFFQLWIVRAADVGRVKWQFLDGTGLWHIKRQVSPVIEYTPGYRRDGTPKIGNLRSGAQNAYGRMWFHTGSWLGPEDPDRPEFERWADSKLRWVRRHWTYDGFLYLSPAAAGRELGASKEKTATGTQAELPDPTRRRGEPPAPLSSSLNPGSH